MKKAVFASGCFWGTEYYFDRVLGVVETTVGYTGGHVSDPTYEQVSSGETGHVEAVLVEYDADLVNYETLAKLFFETHDPTQTDGQGPDTSSQYYSKIFYSTDNERKIAEHLINILKSKGLEIATGLEELKKFYPAEKYHQDYYAKSGGTPYCHVYRKLFEG